MLAVHTIDRQTSVHVTERLYGGKNKAQFLLAWHFALVISSKSGSVRHASGYVVKVAHLYLRAA